MRTNNKILTALGLSLITSITTADTILEIDNRVRRTDTDARYDNFVPYAPDSYTMLADGSDQASWVSTILRFPGPVSGPLYGAYVGTFGNLIQLGVSKVIPQLYPVPEYVHGILDRIDAAADRVIEHIEKFEVEFELQEKYYEAVERLQASRAFFDGYTSVSFNGENLYNEFRELEKTPIHRSRSSGSLDHIHQGMNNLEEGLDRLNNILENHMDYPELQDKDGFEILIGINAKMMETLPFYVEIVNEYYQSYKWPENTREAALQERYIKDIVPQWAYDEVNRVAPEYRRIIGDFGPGEPYRYSPNFRYTQGPLAVSEKEFEDSKVLQYLKTLYDFKEKHYEHIVDTSVDYQVLEDVDNTYVCGTYICKYILILK